jgi:glycosyltransferase involved in cell wall biosynthesis
MEKKKIGLYIITFNRKRFTEECFKSILWSKPKQTEIVIVDNGSNKETLDIVKKFSEENKDLVKKVFYNKENLFVGASWNQAWNYMKDSYEILGGMNNDFFVAPGWEENIISCFSELNLDFLVGSVRGEWQTKQTPSKKGCYSENINPVGSAYFILSKHYSKGMKPLNRPFSKGYVGPGPSFHRMLLKNKLRGVRIGHPGFIPRDPEYSNPEFLDYYDKTFKIRGLTNVLTTRRGWEYSGRRHGNGNWNYFLSVWYPEKFKEEKENYAATPIFKKDNLWYFWNETWTEVIGPFESKKIAEEELEKYSKQLG